jgi:pimeloyl-ACP methyl ester carboxylesterase
MPRTVTRSVEELHALLAAAGEPPPFIMVGHSYGGIIVRLFAQYYPHEVAGLVLLDASAPDQFVRLPEAALPTALIAAARSGARTVSMPKLVAALPAELQTTAMHLMMLPKARRAYVSEIKHFESATKQLKVQADGALDVRLVVVSRSRNVFGQSDEAVFSEYVWQDMQRRMAALSKRSDHWIAAGAGHVIHADRPDLVALAVREAAQFDWFDTRWPLDSPVRLVLDDRAFPPPTWHAAKDVSPQL